MNKIMTLVIIGVLAGSASGPRRMVVDSSPEKPDWLSTGKLTWEKSNFVYFKTKQTIRGDQSVDGCYDLGSLGNQELVLKEMANEVKGSVDNAKTDISENAELVLSKVRSGKWEGRLSGLKDDEQYFERYQIRDDSAGEKVERIDCYAVSKISKADYLDTKRAVVNKIVAIDPRIKEAIAQKQIDFFSEGKAAAKDGGSANQGKH